MAIHHPTPPFSGGERPRLPSAQVGPVTQGVRAMRAADPADRAIAAIQDGLDRHFAQVANPVLDPRQFTHGIRALSRPEVEDLIGGLIDLLDAMDGDADLEPSLAAPEPVITNGWGNCPHSNQAHWAGGATDDQEHDAGSDREEENEHGGDIQDEPHDPQPDDVLPSMHRWDPRVAEGARAVGRQAWAMRARKDREARG